MINFHGAEWQTIEAYLKDKLAKEREKNENPDIDHDRTQFNRGRIALIKELLGLPKAEQLKVAQARIDHPD